MAVITEKEGDIFNVPPNSILLHACNARGVWGKGVALAFKKRFPKAFREYHQQCNTKPPLTPSLAAHRKSLVGTFVITCIDHTSDTSLTPDNFYYVVSLITSDGYGKHVSDAATILHNTAEAIRVLKSTIDRLRSPTHELKVYAVKINSGLFSVPWEATKRVLEAGEVDMTVLISPSPTTPTKKRKDEMTESAGLGSQKKRRRKLSQSSSSREPVSRKKRI